jgi:phosphatidyl-myo-inositol dimannoside synthase
MRLGAALGVSSGDGLSHEMACPLRIFALVTDAFGGSGGIAHYNRHLLSSLMTCSEVGEVIALPRGGDPRHIELTPRLRQLRPLSGRRVYSLAALREAQVRRPIDVVFCGHLFMAPLAAAVARLVRARLWIQVHGIEAWQELSGLHRRALEMADLVTSVSRYTRHRLLAWAEIDPIRVKVLPNTFDSVFRPGPKSSHLMDRHAAHGKKVLMTVARLAATERYKGQDRVIRILPRVLAEHPETIYMIIGEGNDRARLETLAREFGVREKVSFASNIPRRELPDYLRLADVLVMPSTGEGFGIVFLEALASGVPVIGGTRDGSVDPLADGVLGRTVDPENGEELTTAVCAALRDTAPGVGCADRFALPAFRGHLQALMSSSFFGAA